MKSATLLSLQKLEQLKRRLDDQERQPVWEPQAATLFWTSRCDAVEQVMLRPSGADELVHLALVTRLRCQPASAHPQAALRLMRLSATTALPGWLLDEPTGAILLRVVLFGSAASLDLERLDKTIAACERLIQSVLPQLARIAAGQAADAPEAPSPTGQADGSSDVPGVFRSFSE